MRFKKSFKKQFKKLELRGGERIDYLMDSWILGLSRMSSVSDNDTDER